MHALWVLGTQHRACTLTKTQSRSCLLRSQFGGKGRPVTRHLTSGDDQSCDGDIQGTVQTGSLSWSRPDTGLIPGPNLPWGGSIPSSLQSPPLHGGKRSSPERYRQEAQRGQGWPGRRWQVLGHHTLGPGQPRDRHFYSGHTCLSVLTMWIH